MTGKSGFIGGPTDPFETPDAPEITGVSAGVLTADVTFTAPADTGGAAIDSYVITAKQSDGTSVSATASAAGTTTVTMTAGGTTTFGAQAFNLYGAGQFSGLGNSTSVLAGQELYAWGDGAEGRTGLNDQIDRSSPVQVGALTNWSQVSCNRFSFGVTTSGELYVWGGGFAATTGALGLNDAISRSSPTQVGALTNWSQASAGNGHGASVKTDGTLWTSGRNVQGQLGFNDTIYRSSPTQVGASTDWVQVSVSGSSTAAITTSGELYIWGRNNVGQLGDNTTTDRSSPVQLGASSDWAQVSAGSSSTLAIKTDGTMWAWGGNNQGRLGINQSELIDFSSPVQIGALTNWSTVSTKQNHASAIKTDGTLWIWGSNSFGRLGLNNTTYYSSPVQVGSLSNWSQVSAGYTDTAAVTISGELYAWGRNNKGQGGINTLITTSSPVQVGAETDWTSISVGSDHTLATLGVTS